MGRRLPSQVPASAPAGAAVQCAVALLAHSQQIAEPLPPQPGVGQVVHVQRPPRPAPLAASARSADGLAPRRRQPGEEITASYSALWPSHPPRRWRHQSQARRHTHAAAMILAPFRNHREAATRRARTKQRTVRAGRRPCPWASHQRTASYTGSPDPGGGGLTRRPPRPPTVRGRCRPRDWGRGPGAATGRPSQSRRRGRCLQL